MKPLPFIGFRTTYQLDQNKAHLASKYEPIIKMLTLATFRASL